MKLGFRGGPWTTSRANLPRASSKAPESARQGRAHSPTQDDTGSVDRGRAGIQASRQRARDEFLLPRAPVKRIDLTSTPIRE